MPIENIIGFSGALFPTALHVNLAFDVVQRDFRSMNQKHALYDPAIYEGTHLCVEGVAKRFDDGLPRVP
ncbi:hypothetical protein BU15DRAFT_84277 [Melanogaster broomeanus]|nr:hypothetical protein BU15DRAFT_84277 [Melanogaster broomeanus]